MWSGPAQCGPIRRVDLHREDLCGVDLYVWSGLV